MFVGSLWKAVLRHYNLSDDSAEKKKKKGEKKTRGTPYPPKLTCQRPAAGKLLATDSVCTFHKVVNWFNAESLEGFIGCLWMIALTTKCTLLHTMASVAQPHASYKSSFLVMHQLDPLPPPLFFAVSVDGKHMKKHFGFRAFSNSAPRF